jgi:predicted dehydrogenase
MHELARSIIERGDLGKVTLVQAFLSRGGEASAWVRRMSHDGGPPRDRVHWELFLGSAPQRPYDARRYFEWRRYWDYSSGIAGDLMSHDLDTIHTVMGLDVPHSATASGGVYYWKDGRETPDTYSAILEYPDDDLSVTYSCNLHSNYHKRATLFLGSEATMELGFDLKVFASAGSKKYAEQLKSGEIKLGQPFVKIGTERGEVITEASPSELWLENQGLLTTVRDGQTMDVTRVHHQDFYACVRDRSEPLASFDEVYAPTVATHMTTEAYRRGRKIVWDPEERKAG